VLLTPVLLAGLPATGCEREQSCGFWLSDSCLDRDGDGYGWWDKDEDRIDCDDDEPTVHPRADEICNYIDDDCDGEVDEEPIARSSCFCDADGDGFGSAAVKTRECDCALVPEVATDDVGNELQCSRETDTGTEAPTGPLWVEDATDCDDEDPAVASLLWYPDEDGDGYGSGEAVLSCSPPQGHVPDDGDCAETGEDSERIHPGAIEICADGIDNNCSEGEEEIHCAVDMRSLVESGAVRLKGEHASDRFGNGVAVLTEESAGDQLVVGVRLYDGVDPETGTGTHGNSGGVYVFDAQVEQADEGVVIAGSSASEYAGWTVASAGDFDQDGHPDFLVGAPEASPEPHGNVGLAYLVLGPLSTEDPQWLTSEGIRISGPENDSEFGHDLSSGDLNGDGYTDVVIGAPLTDDPGPEAPKGNAGAAYVLLGTDTDLPSELCTATTEHCDADERLLAFYGTRSKSHAGRGVAIVEDMDGDGLDELAVGAPLHGDAQSGGVHLVRGWDAGTAAPAGPLDDATTFVANGFKDYAGYSVDSAGDFDGDGYGDLVIGVPQASYGEHYQTGMVYWVLGRAGGFGAGESDLYYHPHLYGEVVEQQFGLTVTGVGNLDDEADDDFDDVLIGTSESNLGLDYDLGNAGLVMLVRGQADPDAANRYQASAEIYGSMSDEGLGNALAGPLWRTSVDGGGGLEPWLALGAYTATDDAISEGAVFLVPYSFLLACDPDPCARPENSRRRGRKE